MSRLRVIIVTPDPPDPFGNAAARWYYVLAKGLASRGHRVSCLSAYSRHVPEASIYRAREHFNSLGIPLELHRYPERNWLARKWTTIRRPYSFFISDSLRHSLERLLRNGYDILNLEQMWTGYLGIGVERSLLSVHHLQLLDLAGAFVLSSKFLTSKHFMCRAERRLIRDSTDIRVTTERLRIEVQALNPHASVYTVPVGIDQSLYDFAPSDWGSMTVGLVASMAWQPGYTAALRLLERVWPRVRKLAPEAKLLIVGWNARRALARHLDLPGVRVVENVPDTKTYFHELSVLAYPLSRGSGMKIKLLEAMAYGTPIVTTTEGAEGIPFSDGHDGFVADEDDLLAERIVSLLLDEGLHSRMSHAGRNLVEEKLSANPTVARMEAVYQSLVQV